MQMVTDRITQADQVLRKSGPEDWENIKRRAVLRAKYRVYNTDKAETTIPFIVKEYIAGLALLRVIPAAISWFTDKRRLAESERALNITFYNLAEVLGVERASIMAELAQDDPLVMQMVSGYAAESVMDIDSLHVPRRGMPFTTDLADRKATFDPFRGRLKDKPSE